MYENIRRIIQKRKEQLMKSNPAMIDWDDEKFARAIETCTVSGVVRDGISLLIEKEVKKQ